MNHIIPIEVQNLDKDFKCSGTNIIMKLKELSCAVIYKKDRLHKDKSMDVYLKEV